MPPATPRWPQDQTFGAIEAFSGALALKRDSMLAHLKRGDTYRRRGELTAALRDLREAASARPDGPEPVELLGDVNAAMGRYQRAAEHYRAFIALDDRSPRVLYKLALAYYRNGQAQERSSRCAARSPSNDRFAEAHYLLGMCLRDREQNDEALRALTRAVEINPAFAAAREELVDLSSSGPGRSRTRSSSSKRWRRSSRRGRAARQRRARLRAPGAAPMRPSSRSGARRSDIPTSRRSIPRSAGCGSMPPSRGDDRVALSKAIEALQPLAASATRRARRWRSTAARMLLPETSRGAERILLRRPAGRRSIPSPTVASRMRRSGWDISPSRATRCSATSRWPTKRDVDPADDRAPGRTSAAAGNLSLAVVHSPHAPCSVRVHVRLTKSRTSNTIGEARR